MRIDRAGVLPDRCVICNGPAGGRRVAQKLYCSPLAWKLCALPAPFVVAGLGMALQAWWMVALFWPMVIVLVIANFFVRKSQRVELGLCARHRHVRSLLRALSVFGILGLLASIPLLGQGHDYAYAALLGSLGGLILLVVLQSFTGIQTLRLKEVSGQHAWLARTGKPFRAALPELPS